MDKLIFWIKKWVGFDGLLHFSCSAIMACFLALFFTSYVSAFITLFAGICKEIYDYYSGKGIAEKKDLFCDLAGILIGIL